MRSYIQFVNLQGFPGWSFSTDVSEKSTVQCEVSVEVSLLELKQISLQGLKWILCEDKKKNPVKNQESSAEVFTCNLIYGDVYPG